MVFTTDRFLQVAIESWPEWDAHAYTYIYTHTNIHAYTHIYRHIPIHMCIHICVKQK